jgi:rare lipoprotein A
VKDSSSTIAALIVALLLTIAVIGLMSMGLSLFSGSIARGTASWYGDDYRGATMANGERFDPDAITCAMREVPLDSLVRVRRVATGATIVARVTDRGPALGTGCVVDLSRAAFARLAPLALGRIEVEISSPLAAADGATPAPRFGAAAAASPHRSVVPVQRGKILGRVTAVQGQTCGPVPSCTAPIVLSSAKACRPLRLPATAAGPQQILEINPTHDSAARSVHTDSAMAVSADHALERAHV